MMVGRIELTPQQAQERQQYENARLHRSIDDVQRDVAQEREARRRAKRRAEEVAEATMTRHARRAWRSVLGIAKRLVGPWEPVDVTPGEETDNVGDQ